MVELNEDEDLEEPLPSRYHYDVFLSFRGEDTRLNFTKRLYAALDSHGVRTFIDDVGLDRGSSIAPTLLDAIEDSAAAIAVISRNYANSRWCLEELAKIVELRRLLLPVFYRVDPSDVRRRKGPFEDDFRNHEVKFGEDSEQVLKWKSAFEKVGGIAGWHASENCDEGELVQELVRRILIKLSNTPLGVAKHPVGISSRVEEVTKILDLKHNGVLVVGFHGMGGIGKTTLARAVYNAIIGQFIYRSFISNIRTTSAQYKGLVSLQNKLIRDLSPDNGSNVDEVSTGISTIKGRVHDKRILVVLDDVDDISQLDALAGKKDWFGAGSRIIVTTRDKQVLVQSRVNEIYEVRTLSQNESLQLFSYYAFGKAKPPESFMRLSESLVSCIDRLPLALEVVGAFLFGKKRKTEWEDELEKLKKIQPGDLHNVLKISFDGLDEEEKCIFLDMACFFVELEMQRESVIDILKGCGFSAEVAITVLTTKCLIKVVDRTTLWMHDQLRDMGRQIVRQENQDVGKRSRLWDHGDITAVLKYDKGTRSIQGIVFNFDKYGMQRPRSNESSTSSSSRRFNLSYLIKYLRQTFRNPSEGEVAEDDITVLEIKRFTPMVNLRLLQINHMSLKGEFKLLPGELKWLQWKGCPMEALPCDFNPQELAVLDLTESRIKQVWDLKWSTKKAMKLIVLNLLGCFNLTATPDFSGLPRLEKLILERCSKLTKLHKTIGDLEKLRILNLKDCSSLANFPDDISGLRSLETLILSGCFKLNKLPEDLRSMKSLKELLLDRTGIMKLPDSIWRVIKLEKLSLNYCTSLQELPHSLGRLTSLRELSLNSSSVGEIPDSIGCLIELEILSLMRCQSLSTIPDTIGRLKSLLELHLDHSPVTELPASIGSLSHLEYLSVANTRLDKLPSSISGLSSLVKFQLDRTLISELPDEIGKLKMLKKLEMRNCQLLCFLPDSIGTMFSLKSLVLENAAITKLPTSLGLLENLEVLNVNKCKRLSMLPASVGNLKCLVQLLMEETGVAELPEKCGMLSSLLVLKMAKKEDTERPQSTGDHGELNTVLPSSLSNLSLLETLDARNCMISGTIPDSFEKLSSLEDLNLSNNIFWSLPSSMRGLSSLKKLSLANCMMLKFLPPLPSSLTFLDATNCTALESVYDLSSLENLEELRFTNCKNITDVPGLECLKSLIRLYMGGCTACDSVIKTRLSKVALKRLRNLCIPGSEIPPWFVKEVPSYASHRNRKIKSVIVCVVISLDQQMLDDFRDKLPAIVDIKARIIRGSDAIFSTTLYLIGVPKTHEDQVYLCRYLDYSPLVSLLKDGDKIEVAMRNPPLFNGLTLSKYGIHLVFEDDDDDHLDEESLDETEISESVRLAKFFTSTEDNSLNSNVNPPETLTEPEENEHVQCNYKRWVSHSAVGLIVLLIAVKLRYCEGSF